MIRVLFEPDIIDMTNHRGKKTGRETHPVDLHPLDDLLGFHTRLAMMKLRRSFLKTVGDGDLRPGIASLLLLVSANPGVSQTDLSRAMHVDKASLVAMLDKAETAGWLTRDRSRLDRRRHELRLTADGEKKARTLRKQILQLEKKFVDRFTRTELSNLIEYLKRIYD